MTLEKRPHRHLATPRGGEWICPTFSLSNKSFLGSTRVSCRTKFSILWRCPWPVNGKTVAISKTVTVRVNWDICIATPTSRPRVHRKADQSVLWCPRMESERNVFCSRWNESVDGSNLFNARRASTEKALSPIHRRVSGTTRSSHDKARNADRVQYPRCSPASVQKATCGLINTVCIGSFPLLVISEILGDLESHSHDDAAWGPRNSLKFAETVPVWKLEYQPAQRYSSPKTTGQVL